MFHVLSYGVSWRMVCHLTIRHHCKKIFSEWFFLVFHYVSDCCYNERIAWQWKDTCCKTYSSEYGKAKKSVAFVPSCMIFILVFPIWFILIGPCGRCCPINILFCLNKYFCLCLIWNHQKIACYVAMRRNFGLSIH